jgi:hypothetical protein
MEDKAARSIPRVCQYLLRQSIRLYPPEQSFWGHAAAAEVQAMTSQFGMVRWTWGALWVAIRAGLSRLLSRPSDFFLGTNSFLRLSWRSLSPLVLVLSLSMFLVPQFRQALKATTSMWIAGDPDPGLSARTFQRLQRKAEREHDAQTLAFLAMRSHDAQASLRLADQAVALDPGLTWIFVELPFRVASTRVDQLQQWDPGNAFLYLRQADAIEWSAQVSEKKDQQTVLEEMRAGKTEFRAAMERALAAPRYDSYLDRRLQLDREVMRKHDIAEPLLLLTGLQNHQLVSLFHLRTYATWILAEAKGASGPNNLPAFEDTCRKIVRFGERMETQTHVHIERLMGGGLQHLAGKELVPILRQQGKTEEAETLAYTLQSLKQQQTRDMILQGAVLNSGYAPNYALDPFNPGIIIHAGALGYLLTLVLLAASLLYLRLRHVKGVAVVGLPRAISYAPWLLFLSALVLLVSYMPYARVFDMYMVSQEMAQGNVFPWNDPQLLSILSNLQYPFQFVRGPDIWHAALWIAFGIVMATTAYVFWRVRVSPAGN